MVPSWAHKGSPNWEWRITYPVTVDGICSEIKFQAVSFAAETTGGSPTGI